MEPSEETKYLLEQAKVFETAKLATVTHQRILNQHLFDLKKVEIQTKGAVATEADPTGKPSFSNQEKREAEVARRLGEDENYRRLQNLVGLEEDLLEELKAAIEISRMNIQVWDIIRR